ncbi:MAG: DUF547 domain-containing protein [Saprospiraceae bacterium]|nr:DUF547 domain-containing protein [Saprospiraceae bacterium]
MIYLLCIPILLIVLWWLGARAPNRPFGGNSNPALVSMSGELLLKVKKAEETRDAEGRLQQIKFEDLLNGLQSDDERKAFWINIYNAWFQILAARDKKAKPAIFREKLIPIAGQRFSLDDIEHGILRKYRLKLALGYLPMFYPASLIKRLSVSAIDFRIHFALNCGAVSCPPIAFYTADAIQQQLELATDSFITTDITIDEEEKIISISKLMLWFRGDFGGCKGIRKMLTKYLQKDLTIYTIRYKDYHWDSKLNNFSDQS